MSQHNLPELPARWYSVDSAGAATLCVDESDATRQAEQNNKMYPRFAPHRAVKFSALSEQGAGEAVATAWAVYDSQGFYELHVCEDTAKKWCDKYNARDVDPLKPYTYRKCQLFEPRPQAAQPARVVDHFDDVPLADEVIELLNERGTPPAAPTGGRQESSIHAGCSPIHRSQVATPSQQADHSPDGGNMVEQQAGAVTELETQLAEALQELADCGAEAWSEDRPCVKDARTALAAYEAKKAGGVS